MGQGGYARLFHVLMNRSGAAIRPAGCLFVNASFEPGRLPLGHGKSAPAGRTIPMLTAMSVFSRPIRSHAALAAVDDDRLPDDVIGSG